MSLILAARRLVTRCRSPQRLHLPSFRRRAIARHRRMFFEPLESRALLAFDFGDAPDTSPGTGAGNYQSLLANDGPRHVIDTTQTSLLLGARVDSEANANPNAKAN